MPFSFKSSALTKGALSLLSLSAGIIVESAEILDLSQPFPEGNPINEDAAFISSSFGRDIRRFLVIEDGEIVMDYQRDNIGDDSVYELWSATKAAMSMIIGTIMWSDQYDLTFEDTLGAILPPEAWAGIQDPQELAFKQSITIKEMLTMTSGLSQDVDPEALLIQDDLGSPVANSAGSNQKASLAVPQWNSTQKGEFDYMPTSNILSYVIVAVTGMTPLEYVSIEVFPSLGIDTSKIDWDQNDEGVQSSFSGLKMTAKDMAKIAQLYLQKGLAAPDKRLLSERFVELSLTEQTRSNVLDSDDPYGLLWMYSAFNKTDFPTTMGDGMWCGSGFMGQAYCFNYESKRVVVYQRSNSIWNYENWFILTYVAMAAFESKYTFDTPVDPSAFESGAFSHTVLGVLGTVALSSFAAFWY